MVGIIMLRTKKTNKPKKLSKTRLIFMFLTIFIVSLSIIFALWYPLAPYYGFARYWVSAKLLNLVGFYPHSITFQSHSTQGDFFSFLPFFALMVSTYKRSVTREWKYILTVLSIIVMVETLGTFFELWHGYQKLYFSYIFSIFFLATARVAIPFFAWWISLEKNQIRLF